MADPDDDEFAAAMMRLDLTRVGEAAVIRAEGELDTLTAPKLAAALDTARREAEPGAMVVLDLSGVSFLSSAGLALLVTASADQAMALRVTGADHGVVGRAIRVTGVDKVLRMYRTVADALTGLD
ncbi:MAG TPA: STAS domain-containing protein [Pseudonocardiaceae bacterium]|nr:STAS domain-containing protein [Pseudonocardiaceae bacterium]